MQNEQAEQNLYETAGAEPTERSERSETRSSVNRFAYMSAEAPALRGELRGSADHPTAEGSIFAYWLDGALYLQAEILGLPPDRVFGFHIHDGIICGSPDSGGASGAFAEAGPHLSLCPEGTWCGRHPYHAGNLPADNLGFRRIRGDGSLHRQGADIRLFREADNPARHAGRFQHTALRRLRKADSLRDIHRSTLTDRKFLRL